MQPRDLVGIDPPTIAAVWEHVDGIERDKGPTAVTEGADPRTEFAFPIFSRQPGGLDGSASAVADSEQVMVAEQAIDRHFEAGGGSLIEGDQSGRACAVDEVDIEHEVAAGQSEIGLSRIDDLDAARGVFGGLPFVLDVDIGEVDEAKGITGGRV